MEAPVVLAHVGPVHEGVLVGVPLVVLVVILLVGRRRAAQDALVEPASDDAAGEDVPS